ncbi:MAG: hypothetical protein ACJAWW_001727 [Sulfurimonas sp.]|jgi:hypothetical protein
MKNILDRIDNAKYVMIVVDAKYLSGASALYTYILRLHKKVSLVCQTKNISNRLSFLPWFEKIKSSKTESADFVIELKNGSIELYDLFKYLNIKINPKMATALYGGLLLETKGFTNTEVNGTIFAMAQELIECGANHKMCSDSVLKSTTLSALRLKSIMLKNMVLKNNAKAAVFFISNNDIKSSGCVCEDLEEHLIESLKLPYVELSVLLDADNEYEVLKLIYKEI